MFKAKKAVEDMNGYAVPMETPEWDVKLDANENNYGASPAVIKALRECSAEDISYYPFYGALSEKIAEYRNCSLDNIKVSNGADEALQAVIQTYLEPRSALLTLDVSFEMPVIYAKIQGCEVIKIPFAEKWKFPIESFLKELKNDKVKAVYLASPNNPSGCIIDEKDLVKILDNSENKAVIIDETYANYAGLTYQKYAFKYDNVFIVRSFSKDFALAGLRLGYIISSAENIKNLKKVISPFSVNALAAKAGIAALNDIEYFEKIKQEIDNTKQEMKVFFETAGFEVYPSYANFLLVNFGKKAEFVFNSLKKAGIIVKLYSNDSTLKGHIRITVPNKAGFIKLKNALKIKPALVFDMDGVLINAVSYRETIRRTYEKYTGKTVSHEEIQAVKNKGGMNNDWDLTKYLLEKAGVNVSYEEIVKTFQEIYWNEGRGLINIETALFNSDMFKKLLKDYNISIYTGRLKKEAEFAVSKFHMSDIFFPVITSDDVPAGRTKPHPDGLDLMKELVLSDKFFYFGDTLDDIKCAKSAGYTAAGVLPPQDKSEELVSLMKQQGADYVIKSVDEIPELMEKIYERVL